MKTLTRLPALAALLTVLVLSAPALQAADGALSFDGVDDFVEVPNFQTLGVTDEVTVEFWAKADVLKQQAAFMLNPDNALNRFQASISDNSGGNMNTYWDFGDIGNGGRVFVANPANTVGNWTHYAFVTSASAATEKMKIYVNGALAASVNTMNAFETLVSSSLRIGGNTGFFFDGSLDEFRVWNVARPQSAIQANLGGPLTGSEAGLRLYFKFDEGSGTTAANSATATATATGATHPTGTLNGNPTWSTPARKTYVVTNANDTGAGSLRAILTTAATDSGPALITFAFGLNGGTITLTGPQDGSALAMNDPGGVTIDATSLPGGLTIQRDVVSSIGFSLFRVAIGSSLALTGLTLKDGGGAGPASFSGGGGGILNLGTLTLTRCTLSGNSAFSGGGIWNTGTLTVNQSTLSGNSAGNGLGGGGIQNTGTLTVNQSTLSGNRADNASNGGGGILNTGTLTVTQSTLSGNSTDNSPSGGSGGGGIFNNGPLTVNNSIVAGNTPNNISGNAPTGTNNITIGDSLLAPLASNGGPTQTMALLPSSPARNAAAVLSPAITRDQRGLPIVGVPDIGAYEASPFTTAGIHQNLGGRWRTASVAKPQDIDGNNVLGTDGYHVVNRSAVLPAYVGTSAILTTTFPGNNEYALLDDPLAMPGTFRSGTMNPAPGMSNAADLFEFSLNAQAAGRIIRVGLLVDNLHAADFNSDSLQLLQTAPESTSSTVVSTTSTAFNDRVADWVFMDIEVGAGGGTFRVRGLAGVQGTATLGGVSFDSVLMVTNTNDTGPGSLRQALATAAAAPGADTITFTPGLTGPITLTSGEIVITSDVTIDATSLPAGLTISGNNASRILSVSSGKTVALHGLTLTGGNAVGAAQNGNGGAIVNFGTLTLTRCTLSGNASANGSGGAVLNDGGTLSFAQCTLSGNSASGGGAISNGGTLTLMQCTLSRNTASSSGGAVFNVGDLSLSNTIAAGNSAPSGLDVFQSGSSTITPAGVNLLSNLANSGLTQGAAVLVGEPKLSPLGYFGGAVQTMHPLIGSPAIDAAGSIDPGGTDARGFPRFVKGDNASPAARLDIGAVEAGRLVVVTIAGDAPGVNNFRGLMASAPSFGKGTRLSLSPNITQIALTEGQLTPPADYALFIDASDLPGGLTISGNNAYPSRVFNIPATATVALHSVKIINGKALAGSDDINGGIGDHGGGILTAGSLSLFSCTLSENSAGSGGRGYSLTIVGGRGGSGGSGGGISNSGSLSLYFCTFSQNLAGSGGSGSGQGRGGSGGGISSSGSLSLYSCSFSGNAAGYGGLGGEGGGISNSGALSLYSCTFSENAAGNGAPISRGGNGGGISNSGSLSLYACTLSRNSAGFSSSEKGGGGGGIFSSGSLRLFSCTLSGNSAGNGQGGGDGGGIDNRAGVLTLQQCTLSGNVAGNAGSGLGGSSGGGGGGISNSGVLSLFSCTIAGNRTGNRTTGNFGGGADGLGGGVSGGTVSLQHCLIAQNFQGSGTTPDDVSVSSLTYVGANLLSTAAAATTTSGTLTPAATNPLLAPLADYGGPTQTMALRPNSPARNAAIGSTNTTDQRGFPIVGVPDIGAYEAGTFTDFNAWIYESLPATATLAQHATTFDYDGDGVTNGNEWAALTDPASATDYLRITSAVRSGANVILTFPSVTGRTYTLWQSDTLSGAWTDTGQTAVSGNGTPKTFTIPAPLNGVPKRFHRVQVSQ